MKRDPLASWERQYARQVLDETAWTMARFLLAALGFVTLARCDNEPHI